MRTRTITVKGVGSAVSRPDQITIPITLTARDLDYQQTMCMATEQHEALKASLSTCNIPAADIKTLDYNVDARYENERDRNGNFKNRFCGYECTHQLRVRFDLDMQRLGQVLCAIADCSAQPRCNVQFGVKNPEAMMQAVLENAAKNARAKALILATASGVALGELQHIDYSWTDVNFYSETRMLCAASSDEMRSPMAIEPDDVSASENVTFVWGIR